ncbi:hypothetical protein JOB18_028484 [Solea senegalensis]|uniref:Uncharacterized protein n=1 Tax=Solea senegalensis TaxID=28829 RepID=A0AAV6PFV9_SOLSE|nr:hypothetical protein JOB18_028484 [Solea senegalensis]
MEQRHKARGQTAEEIAAESESSEIRTAAHAGGRESTHLIFQVFNGGPSAVVTSCNKAFPTSPLISALLCTLLANVHDQNHTGVLLAPTACNACSTQRVRKRAATVDVYERVRERSSVTVCLYARARTRLRYSVADIRIFVGFCEDPAPRSVLLADQCLRLGARAACVIFSLCVVQSGDCDGTKLEQQRRHELINPPDTWRSCDNGGLSCSPYRLWIENFGWAIIYHKCRTLFCFCLYTVAEHVCVLGGCYRKMLIGETDNITWKNCDSCGPEGYLELFDKFGEKNRTPGISFMSLGRNFTINMSIGYGVLVMLPPYFEDRLWKMSLTHSYALLVLSICMHIVNKLYDGMIVSPAVFYQQEDIKDSLVEHHVSPMDRCPLMALMTLTSVLPGESPLTPSPYCDP